MGAANFDSVQYIGPNVTQGAAGGSSAILGPMNKKDDEGGVGSGGREGRELVVVGRGDVGSSRVRQDAREIEGKAVGKIDRGLNVLVGVGQEDTEEDANWLAAKIAALRIFNDQDGVMNLSVNEVGGDVLAISQFTLHAKTKKGTRPSYIRAAKPDLAIPLYEHFLKVLEKEVDGKVESGVFGADMKVLIDNDGPVTILIDTKNKD